jgi:hypothetical protein
LWTKQNIWSKNEELKIWWRKLYCEVLRNIYSKKSPYYDQIKKDELGGASSTHRRCEEYVNIRNLRPKSLRKISILKTKEG